MGGYLDGNFGAAWVYTRSGGIWTQQGNKLVGTGAVGHAFQGCSVSLSADGNTAIVGGYGDSADILNNGSIGAAWVYARSGGVWTQQGSKLVGTGAVGDSRQGYSVSISADGNTAIVGGYGDNNEVGAAWIYKRSGGIWTQMGNKLVGTGAVGAAYQGISVSISSDGNTAIVGGEYDNSYAGAAWIYKRSGGVWHQQGSKLGSPGSVGNYVDLGSSVSLSVDGNIAIVGGYFDNSNLGAAWVYNISGGIYNKLLGMGAVGSPVYQGISVSISADGNTAIVGGYGDNNEVGAAWVYASCIYPSISSQSTSAQMQCLNGSFTPITVTATGSNLSYQWYSNTTANNGEGTSLGLVNGAQTYSYTPQATILGTLYYYCIVGGYCGTPQTSEISGTFIVKPHYNIVSLDTICQGNSVVVGTHSYITQGTYIDSLKTISGCDSIITTNLTVNPSYNIPVNHNICQGDSVVVGIHTYNTTGVYTDSLTTAFGCDSIITTNLTVNPFPTNAGTITGTTTACQGQTSVTYNVPTITNASSYVWTLPTGATGTSDSNSITVNYGTTASSGSITVKGDNSGCYGGSSTFAVIINHTYHITTNLTICQGQTYQVGTHIYSTAGTYIDSLSTFSGCDSIIITNLTVNPIYNIQSFHTICHGDSIMVGIHSYNTPGTYLDSLTTVLGCDSIIITNLIVNPSYYVTVIDTTCQGDSVVVGTHIYKITGIYTDHLTTTLGCDSTIITNLTVNPSNNIQTNSSICQGDSIMVGSHIYNATGIYIDHLTSSLGCDSTINTNLTVNPIPPTPTITQTGNTLHSSAASGNQWYNATSGIISSATAQTYNPISNGYYYVIVTLNACSSDSSNHYHYSNVGIETIENNNTIKVYPNPVSNELIIEVVGSKKKVSFEIYNSIGQSIYKGNLIEKTTVQTTSFAQGVYIIKLENGKVFEFKKIVKE